MIKVIIIFTSTEETNPADLGLDNDKIDVQVVNPVDSSDDKVNDIADLIDSGLPFLLIVFSTMFFQRLLR